MNILSDFEYHSPQTLDEALELCEKFAGRSKLLAGGTDLMIMLKEGMIETEIVIDINDIAELRCLSLEPGQDAVIGANVKISELENSEVLQKSYPALSFAAGELGSYQVRVMASMGGNCCHSSPAAETPPVLSAYGAKIVIKSKVGEREMLVEDFILGNRKNDLQPGEIVTKFLLPQPEARSAVKYSGIGLRNALEIDCVNMAVKIALESDNETIRSLKLVMGSVYPRPLVSQAIPALLIGQKLTDALIEEAAKKAQEEAKPISDVRASADYRKDAVAALAKKLLREAYAEAKH